MVSKIHPLALSPINSALIIMRLPYDTIHLELVRVLVKTGFAQERAELCATLFVDTQQDGVYSHGLNRFGRFMKMIELGCIDIHAEPEKIFGFGAIEQWDGQLGPGNLNAHAMMDQAIRLASQHGIGVVALRNTNHWMRGGTYGWQAADHGFIGMCWTNTNQNLPPWGATEARIGNNPLIISIPRKEGHVVLDMAMSQFSYGALASYQKKGQQLPVPGGYDKQGVLTHDPAAIEDSYRPLPIGFWKGSALSIVLDMAASVLSAGTATHNIASDPLKETELSQCFIAISVLTEYAAANAVLNEIVEHLHESPTTPGEQVYYPGQRTLAKRYENIELGIPVDEDVWVNITGM